MRFIKWLEEATVAAGVEKNLAKGHVDVIGAPKYKKKKKKTRLDRRPIVVHETSVSSAVVGSSQTRVVGDKEDITVLKRQPRPLKFMERVGAYLPPDEEEIEEAVKKEDIPKLLMIDPLYRNVVKAKSKKEFDEALDTLKKIRGSNAVELLKKNIKKIHKLKEGYIKEDYFEVTVELKSGNVETFELTNPKNKKQAKKEAVHMLDKDYGKGKYKIMKITREKGNPGTYQGRQEKSKSRYDVDWE